MPERENEAAWTAKLTALTAELEMERKRTAKLRARLRQRNSVLKAERAKVPCRRYGSYTAGIPAWEARWDTGFAESGIERLIDEAALIQIKDETGFFLGTNNLPKGLFAEA